MFLFPPRRLEQNWFFKYKVYHLFFWATYHFLWGVAQFSLGEVIDMLFFSPRWVMYLFYVFLNTLGVYVVLYVLLPKYLEKGKLGSFILWIIASVLVTSFFILGSYKLSSWLINKDLAFFCGFQSEDGFNEVFRFWLLQILPHTGGAILLGLSIKLGKNWSRARMLQQQLEKEKLEAELKFLRSQFNPHFLFNTINSIFFLIQKDAQKASTTLGKFSELLRYQLYECNEQKITLNQEIAYLNNFIDLEKLRKAANFQVDLDINIGSNGYLEIAPFILMPFVENAFKHVSKFKNKPNWVLIKMSFQEENTFLFEVINSQSKEEIKSQEAVQFGGLGLKNVQRRLDLIYPDQHQLIIKDEQTHFMVQLRLELSEMTNTSINLIPEIAVK